MGTPLRYLLSVLGLCSAALGQVTPPGWTPALPSTVFNPEELGRILFRFPEVAPFDGRTFRRAEEATLINGHLFYSGLGAEKSWVYDLRNPRKPAVKAILDYSNNVHTLPTMDNLLFLTGRVIDFSDPAKPVTVGNTGDATAWQSLQYPYMYHSYSYNEERPITVMDYSDPKAPRKVKEIEVSGKLGWRGGTVNMLGNLMFVSGGNASKGVSVWDAGDPLNPVLLSSRQDGRGMYFSTLYGSYLVTAGPAGAGEVTLFDFRDPYDLKKVWEGTIDGMGDYAHFQNGFLYGAKDERFVKFNLAARKSELVGQASGTRYGVPVGNLLWVGADDAWGPPSLSVHSLRPDSTGPALLFSSPLPGQARQPATSRIGLAFDEPIDTRTLVMGNISVHPLGGPPLEAWYTHMQGIVNIRTKKPLLPGTTYEVVVVEGGVRDWSGNPTSRRESFRFSTGASVDPTGVPILAAPRRLGADRRIPAGGPYRMLFPVPGVEVRDWTDAQGRKIPIWPGAAFR